MPNVKTSEILYSHSKKLFGGHVVKGMPMDDLLCTISELVENLFTTISYDCIDLKKLGIICPDEDADKKCLILNWLVDNLLIAQGDITNIYTKLQLIQTTITSFKDEKVKVRAAGTAGYLEDLIKAPAGNIIVTDNDITFMGFVPIGFRGTINSNRITDFDVTGKGKINTDMWGWAIRNGLNGTQNHLGLFPMYAADINIADVQDGQTEFTVDKANIKSLTLPVTGIINDALENNVTFRYEATNNKNGGSRPNGFATNHTGGVEDYDTQPKNFKHGHGFTLTVTHTNPNATPIPLLPKHIKEIPIERIIP